MSCWQATCCSTSTCANLQANHRASGRDVTLLLRRDPREATFGSVGIDAGGGICRIGRHPVAAPNVRAEHARGLFTGVRIFQRDVLRAWPRGDVFEDLRDWLMPRAERGEIRLGAEIDETATNVWEPVGTPEEYLAVNLRPPALPRLGGAAKVWEGAIEVTGDARDVVAARSVRIPGDARLARCVVWDDARVPPGVRARDGVFGARGFHSFAPAPMSGTGVPETGADQRGAA